MATDRVDSANGPLEHSFTSDRESQRVQSVFPYFDVKVC